MTAGDATAETPCSATRQAREVLERLARAGIVGHLADVVPSSRADVVACLRECRPAKLDLGTPAFALEDSLAWMPSKVVVAVGDYAHDYRTAQGVVEYRRFVEVLRGERRVATGGNVAKDPYLRGAPFSQGFALLDATPPHLGLRDVFGEGSVRTARLWAGTRESYTAPHVDLFDNLAIQLLGRKVFNLWHVSDAPLSSCTSATRTGNFWTVPRSDLPRPRVVVSLDPGQGLVIPAGWIHEVYATSTVVMVSFFATRVQPASLRSAMI